MNAPMSRRRRGAGVPRVLRFLAVLVLWLLAAWPFFGWDDFKYRWLGAPRNRSPRER